MDRQLNKVVEIDVAAVTENKTLATAVDRRAIERCKDAIERLGVVHTPVVGRTREGRRLLLSGQSELTALRELKVKKMDAIEIGAADDGGARAKLSLQLLALQDRPGALCEGLLLREAVDAGVPRSEIQSMLGKSASWVSNRISLVTRLDANVYEMVKSGLIEPRSAEEISRLPAEAQFAFADKAVREGLAKSAIESLVAAYNGEGCPDAVKEQILKDPRSALCRMADGRRAANAGNYKPGAPPDVIDKYAKSARQQMEALLRMLSAMPAHKAGGYVKVLEELEASILALLAAVRGIFTQVKTGVGANDG